MKRGLFITFEGGEGAGKTTQIKKLAASLPDTVLTREPGGTDDAEKLRNLFFECQGQNWPAAAQLMLMFTARTLHTEQLIKPSLAAGKIVLCDRYTDSTRVYQGIAGGVPPGLIETIKQAAIGDFEPDLTFIFDLPPENGLARAGQRFEETTFEGKDLSFHHALRDGYLAVAHANPERCVIINALDDIDTIASRILAIVRDRLDV